MLLFSRFTCFPYPPSRCWCGSDDEFDKNGRSDDCDMRCNGNDEQICGGTYALSIYSVNDR